MLALFAGAFFTLRFLALGRLSNTIVERDRRIDGRRHEVAKLHTEFVDIQARLEGEMKKARLDAAQSFAQMKDKAVAEQRSIINAARETAAREIKNVRASVVEKTQEEMKKLESEIPAIAQLIVDQILDGRPGRRNSVPNGSLSTEV